MQDKLQELTDKLYNEGLSKGKQEGEQFLQNARRQAEDIVAKAKEEAEAIIAKANRDASDIRAKAESDVKMASEQCLQATRKDIENLLSAGISDAKIDSLAQDPDFVKNIILTVAEKFSASESCDIELILPEKMKAQLEPWVAAELKQALSREVSASFSKKVGGGFNIGPKDGGWFVSFTDETFRELISAYMRPVTRKLLFGE